MYNSKRFKTARISPIHKGGSHDIDNFRPISVLPSLSKIVERAIHNQLYMYLNENKLLANCQSGFRPLYSTATCLTEIIDYSFDKMYQGNVIGGIFLVKLSISSHTVLFLEKLCIMELKETSIIGWNHI